MNADSVPFLRSSQLTWAVSPPVGYSHPHLPSPFIMIGHPKSWYCTIGKEKSFILESTNRLTRTSRQEHWPCDWIIRHHWTLPLLSDLARITMLFLNWELSWKKSESLWIDSESNSNCLKSQICSRLQNVMHFAQFGWLAVGFLHKLICFTMLIIAIFVKWLKFLETFIVIMYCNVTWTNGQAELVSHRHRQRIWWIFVLL